MYPEKPKRDDEKPKRSSQQGWQAPIRLILALLILVPSLFFLLARFNQEQFIDMILLTMMITLTVYLCYELMRQLLTTVFNMPIESPSNSDFPSESVNR